MSLRHKGRELALQVLFQWDIHRRSLDWMDDFWTRNHVPPEVRQFTEELVQGVMAEVAELDHLIGRSAQNWSVSRMAFVDRAVLRLAVYELLHRPEVPARVTLNEAITLAKDFGDEQSGAFVNGVLDRILRDEPRLRAKAQESASACSEPGRGVAHD